MGNLGAYQSMTELAKRVGGPKWLGVVTLIAGYVFFRPTEAGVKKIWKLARGSSGTCETKGQVFAATSAGECDDLTLHAGDQIRVLESDGDAVLIEVVGDTRSPYFVSSEFLRSVSDFPQVNINIR
jgi:hypothetical protein